jgi:hypothetical protein
LSISAREEALQHVGAMKRVQTSGLASMEKCVWGSTQTMNFLGLSNKIHSP